MREADNAHRSKRSSLAVPPHPLSPASSRSVINGIHRRAHSSVVICVLRTPSRSERDGAAPVCLSLSSGKFGEDAIAQCADRMSAAV